MVVAVVSGFSKVYGMGMAVWQVCGIAQEFATIGQAEVWRYGLV